MKLWKVLALFVLMLSLNSDATAKTALKLLIVDGQNNHQWQKTTPVLKKHLEAGDFAEVDVATSPPKGKDLSGFVPNFSDYDVVVSNYNGALWSKPAQDAFVEYVKTGGGFVVVHAANNAFSKWPEYNEMIGLAWRPASFGDRLTVDDNNRLVRTPAGEGPGAGHGPQHEFPVIVRDADHPICQGLPKAWMHGKDELYHGQRGPAANMQILATAYSPQTKAHEPMMWVIPYGKGRVFTSVMGHADLSMKCVGFIATLRRGTEWAATGKVTEKLPADFPSADKVSMRD